MPIVDYFGGQYITRETADGRFVFEHATTQTVGGAEIVDTTRRAQTAVAEDRQVPPPKLWAPSDPIESASDKTVERLTYGVELETSRCPNHRKLHRNTPFGSKYDDSVEGMEFYSPIFRGDGGLYEIQKFCEQARENQFKVNQSCGYHLHIGMKHFSDKQLTNVAYAYVLSEPIWRSFIPKHRSENGYCCSISGGREMMERAVSSKLRWDRGRAIREWLSCHTRFGINFNAFFTHGTFEIRLHQGTLHTKKINNWILAHMKFVDWAADQTPSRIKSYFDECREEKLLNRIQEVWDCDHLSNYYHTKFLQFNN